MKIVDAQIHIWSSGTPVADHRQISLCSTMECLEEMDAGGVDAALSHSPG
jgi:hypothetical protein